MARPTSSSECRADPRSRVPEVMPSSTVLAEERAPGLASSSGPRCAPDTRLSAVTHAAQRDKSGSLLIPVFPRRVYSIVISFAITGEGQSSGVGWVSVAAKRQLPDGDPCPVNIANSPSWPSLKPRVCESYRSVWPPNPGLSDR